MIGKIKGDKFWQNHTYEVFSRIYPIFPVQNTPEFLEKSGPKVPEFSENWAANKYLTFQ